MNYTITVLCASLLLALFLVTKLLGGKSLNRIKARTVGYKIKRRIKFFQVFFPLLSYYFEYPHQR